MREPGAEQDGEGVVVGIAMTPPGPMFIIRGDAVARPHGQFTSPAQLILGGLGSGSHDTRKDGCDN